MNIERLVSEATKSIETNYFQLPIDGMKGSIYRERVYCYELYHQLRCCWPTGSKYELSGEVDKTGHPLVRGNGLDRIKPDILVHIPGEMRGNHTIIEVKPINARGSGIQKDLRALTAFRKYGGYQKAIYLFYGDGDIRGALNIIELAVNRDASGKIDLNVIEVWWHQAVGQAARKIMDGRRVPA